MYSVIVLGAAGVIGVELAHELSVQKSHFNRVAFLTPLADPGPEKEALDSKVEQQLERMVGSLSDPVSYKGFDIVISVVGDALYAQQLGADLTQPKVRNEPCWEDKIGTRKRLEKRVREDPSLGYSYIMVVLFAEAWFTYNILGLSEDKKSTNFVGYPDAKITTILASDVAEFTIASLHAHLTSLAGPRELKFEGLSLSVTLSYITYEESFKAAEELWEAGVFTFPHKFLTA